MRMIAGLDRPATGPVTVNGGNYQWLAHRRSRWSNRSNGLDPHAVRLGGPSRAGLPLPIPQPRRLNQAVLS